LTEGSQGRQRQVAVIGAGSCEQRSELAGLAEEVGRGLAEAGVVLVSGGLGGVMEAACRGAKETGGTTVGILPGPNRDGANDFVDVAIATGIGEARNSLVASAADAVIAVRGEFGTLSEIALALKAGKPVVGLDTWELARDGEHVEAIERASSPHEAVELALGLARV
jgi:uncharacterized protein (TIGR00725 family)